MGKRDSRPTRELTKATTPAPATSWLLRGEPRENEMRQNYCYRLLPPRMREERDGRTQQKHATHRNNHEAYRYTHMEKGK